MTKLLPVFIMLGFYNAAFSQAAISGPACVRPGLTYQYVISGKWDSASSMHLCITGGKFVSGNSACTPDGPPVPTVQVIWDSASKKGTLSLSSSSGNATQAVTIALPLHPGMMIATMAAERVIRTDSVPLPVSFSAASGGGCSPTYRYQWQQSLNRVDWTDIDGATEQALSFTRSLQQSTFFRRKVTETGSGEIGYTEAVVIYVHIPATSN